MEGWKSTGESQKGSEPKAPLDPFVRTLHGFPVWTFGTGCSPV